MQKRKDRNGRVLPQGVTQRADGRYLYREQINGKSIYLYAKTLNEMKERISKHKLDAARGVDVDLKKLTLNEWYFQYLEIYKKNNIKEMSYRNMINYYTWYVKNFGMLGSLCLEDITHAKVVSHFQELAQKKKLAHKTLGSLASMLFNCFQQAVYDQAITYNPAGDIMKFVKGQPPETRDSLTKEEVGRLVNFLKEDEEYHIYLPAIVTGLGTGLRCGELLGLTWDNVDFKRHVIRVDHTISYKNKGNGHEFFITTPKTKAANREIPMTSEVEEMLKEQKKYQKELRIRDDICIDGWKHFVFTTKLGNPFTHEGFRTSLKRLIKKANAEEREQAKEEGREPVLIPDHTPHWWRHTFCTRLVEANVDYVTLKNLLGHTKVETSIDIYTHISEQLKKTSKETLEGIIKIL